MINKIMNWSFGGFFRTLGKFVAYTLIGLLIALLMQKNDIKIWQLIGIEKVYASTTTAWSTNQSRIVTDFNGSWSYSSWTSSSSAYTPTNPVIGLQYRLKSSDGLNVGDSYTFTVAFKPTPDALQANSILIVDSNSVAEGPSCTGFNRQQDGYYKSTCNLVPSRNFTSDEFIYVRIWFDEGYVTSLGIGVTGYTYREGVGSVFTDVGGQIIDNQNANTQEIIDNLNDNLTNVCPNLLNIEARVSSANGVTLSNQNGIISATGTITAVGSTAYSQSFTLPAGTYYYNDTGSRTNLNFYLWNSADVVSINPNTSFTITSSKTYFISVRTNVLDASVSEQHKLSLFKDTNQSFCAYGSSTNKLDETNQSINDLEDTLKDDDTSSDSNDMADFINDFTLESDSKLSTLVNLPLTFLENVLIQESNAPLCTTFRGKNICLPSGSILWGSSHTCNENVTLCDSSSNVNAFKLLFTILVGGYLSYKMTVSLIHTLNNATDPEVGRIRTVKL